MLFGWSKDEHVYIDHIHHPRSTSDAMLSHDLQLDIGCNFTYATKAIFSCKCWLQLFYDCKLKSQIDSFG